MLVCCANQAVVGNSKRSAEADAKYQSENQDASTASLERLAYGIRDAAAVSGLSRSKLYELIKSGRLSSIKIAGRRLVTRAALLELLNAGGE